MEPRVAVVNTINLAVFVSPGTGEPEDIKTPSYDDPATPDALDLMRRLAVRLTRFGARQEKARDKSLEIDNICKTLRISRSTFYRYVRLY